MDRPVLPPPPPELPVPNADEVSRFQSLFLARFGVELSEEDACDQARRLVQFVFLTQYALPSLRAEKERLERAERAEQPRPSPEQPRPSPQR